MKKPKYDCRPVERQVLNQITNAPKGPKTHANKARTKNGQQR